MGDGDDIVNLRCSEYAARCTRHAAMLHAACCTGMGVRRILRSISCADCRVIAVCPMRSSETHTPRPILAMRRCGSSRVMCRFVWTAKRPPHVLRPLRRCARHCIAGRGIVIQIGGMPCAVPLRQRLLASPSDAGCGRRRFAYRIVKSLLCCDAPQRSTAADGGVGSECRFALQWQHDPRVPSVSYHHLSKVCAHALAPAAAGYSASYSANRRKLRRFIAFQDCKHYECHCTLLPFSVGLFCRFHTSGWSATAPSSI